MKEQIIEVKDYVTKSNLPASDFVINPYVGCPHGCKYCYACFMKRFTKHDEEWGTFIDIKQCSTPINKRRLNGKTVFLSSVTDCYNRYEETYCVTQNILRQLVSIDCTVNISTKSSLILRDIDLLKQFQDLTVSLSINTLDENFKNDMDDASSIIDRLNTLKALHENGIYTVLFMSPIFPMITDFREIIERSHLFVDEYWFENCTSQQKLDTNFKFFYSKDWFSVQCYGCLDTSLFGWLECIRYGVIVKPACAPLMRLRALQSLHT